MSIRILPAEDERQLTAVIIPALNPGDELVGLVAEIRARAYEVVIVDDGSRPVYPDYWQSLGKGAVVIHHERNLGKGQALKTGIGYVERSLPEIRCVATMDADGQHLVGDLETVVAAWWSHPEGLVLGSRTIGENAPLRSRMGSDASRRMFARVAGIGLSDTQTGLRAFGRDLIPLVLGVPGSRFEYETNVLLRCASADVPMREVPIEAVYHDERNSCSHYRCVRDSLRIGGSMLLFAASSFLGFAVDYLIFGALVLVLPSGVAAIPLSAVVARVVSASVNYAVNRSIVFGSSRAHRQALPEYAALACAMLAADCVITTLLSVALGISPLIAKVVSGLLLFSVSYLVQRARVFSPHVVSGKEAGNHGAV